MPALRFNTAWAITYQEDVLLDSGDTGGVENKGAEGNAAEETGVKSTASGG